MIKPIINTRFILPLITAGTMIISSCTENNASKYRTLMKEAGAKSQEIENIVKNCKNDDKYIEAVKLQSALDSIAYRNLFNANGIDDSMIENYFNKIAPKASLSDVVSDKYSEEFNKDRCLDKMLGTIYTEDFDEETIDNMKNSCIDFDNNGTHSLEDYQRFYDSLYFNTHITQGGNANANTFNSY